jgi:GNAT superfamily N-acetyltransferase
VIVREAQEDDEEFILGLVPRFVENGVAGGHTRDEVIVGTSRVLRASLRARLPDEVFFIAEDARGERLGFAYVVTESDFFTGEDYAHVSEIAVARSGEGAGAALMDAADRWSRERGHRLMTLNVVDTNVDAQRFYERRGFAIAHRHYAKRLT